MGFTRAMRQPTCELCCTLVCTIGLIASSRSSFIMDTTLKLCRCAQGGILRRRSLSRP